VHKRTVRSITIVASIAAFAAFPLSTQASHSWGGYHWARTSNPLSIKIVDSMTVDWDDNLSVARSDWDVSTVLSPALEAGDSSWKARKRCAAISGKVRTCNATYGNNGWLGLAQIWLSGGHIIKGIAKMNDSYLASSAYSEVNRQQVICQEIGHVWGLDHQDESGADLNTCMDYADAFDNAHPNKHDYDQLLAIYSHLDSSTSASASGALPPGFAKADLRARDEWGKKVHGSRNGHGAVFVRSYGAGLKIVTHVIWAE
jgi:hypothetical protein